MGIKDFQPYIKKTYKAAFKDFWLDNYDNLYVDVNYVLHLLCYSTETEIELIIRFKDFLQSLIKKYMPQKRVYLMADGVAPMAKMILQRERRMNKSKDEINLKLTVGTKFMSELQYYMPEFIEQTKEKYNIEVIILFVEPGEGEIKIRNQVQETQNKNKNDTHIIFSSDSDMVMLLMTCDDLSKIYIIIKNRIDTQILNLNNLYKIHIQLFGETQTTKYDFVFLNILMGNDYLPHVSCAKFEKLWESYKLFSNYFNQGLIVYENSYIKINKIFLNCILFNLIKNEKPIYVNKFKIKTLFDNEVRHIYEKYCEGFYWCLSMYIMGYCSDYEYIYDTKIKPHIIGVLNVLMLSDDYKIKITEPINYELYGILLAPKITHNILLSKKQNEIIKKLEIIHTNIYDSNITKELIKKIVISFNEINKNYKENKEEIKIKKLALRRMF